MININLNDLPVDVTQHIKKFRLFLIACWPSLDDLLEYHNWDEDGHFIDDWLLLNWEMLVERELLEGEGYLTQFSMTHLRQRFTSSENKPTYTIVAKSQNRLIDLKTNETVPFEKPLRLFSFRTYKDGSFGLYPPFDLANLVLDATNELYTVPFSELEFQLVKFHVSKKEA